MQSYVLHVAIATLFIQQLIHIGISKLIFQSACAMKVLLLGGLHVLS